MNIKEFKKFIDENVTLQFEFPDSENVNMILCCKNGHKIHIKKKNRGKFTEYCKGKVTQECISRGKNSSDPKIRKRATFADNARHWKKK